MTETHSPEPQAETPTFASLGISDNVLRAIEELGWDAPTPVQFECYPRAAEGRDLIVQARTGTGKTGAFGIPLVDRLVDTEAHVQGIVLAPTRELALQSAKALGTLGSHKGVRTAAVYGGAPIERQVRELEAGAQIVSGTPGRVLDHLRRGTLDVRGLKALVLDEADEMLSMGFAKELNAIIEMLPKERQTLLFSATVDGPVKRIGERHTTDAEMVTLSGDAVGALGITHYMFSVSGKARSRDLARILDIEDPESAIIFCNTKAQTEQVAAQLQNAGFQAAWINGDLAQSEREKIMGRARAGDLRFLVATDVAARGIDISHVTHVINFELPNHLEQYIHRTGRTGRAGRTGTAITLVAPQELGTLYYLRLQYGIFPIERTLPSAGEEQTRMEMDRLGLLESAFTAASDADRSLARRLLTHPDAESLIGGLLGAFFGPRGESVDDEAAAARRERKATPVEEPAAEKPEKKKKKKRRRKDKSEAPEAKAEQAEASDQSAAPKAEAAEATEAKTKKSDKAESKAKKSSKPKKAKDEAPQFDDAPEFDEAESFAAVDEAPIDEADEPREERKSDRPARRRREEVEGQIKLYVSLGRKDGIRVGDLNRFFQDEAGLDRDEIGRIRLRDKHSFVYIPEEHVDDVCDRLDGAYFDDIEVKVEPAKG